MWFVSKRYHESSVKHFEDIMSLMRSGHDSQIEALKAQISNLEKLVFPQSRSHEIPIEAREVDSVLNASEKPPEMSEEELNKILDGAREMDLLVSGNYDTDLLQ